MRITAALLLCIFTIWRGYLDWAASQQLETGFVMAEIGAVWQTSFPDNYATTVPWLLRWDLPDIWAEVVQATLVTPALPVLFGLTIFFFAIRRRGGMPRELAYSR
ncbi:MAG: hypothetical protein AAGA32_22705 [Pseudomonadota bacterium]